MPERMTKFADRCGKPPDNCPYRVHPNGQTMGTDVRKKPSPLEKGDHEVVDEIPIKPLKTVLCRLSHKTRVP